MTTRTCRTCGASHECDPARKAARLEWRKKKQQRARRAQYAAGKQARGQEAERQRMALNRAIAFQMAANGACTGDIGRSMLGYEESDVFVAAGAAEELLRQIDADICSAADRWQFACDVNGHDLTGDRYVTRCRRCLRVLDYVPPAFREAIEKLTWQSPSHTLPPGSVLPDVGQSSIYHLESGCVARITRTSVDTVDVSLLPRRWR